MEDWISYSHQKLSVKLRYPNPTPEGHSVHINEISGDSSFRVHFVSDSSHEVYFEVGEYSDVRVQQTIDDFLQDVAERIDGLVSSEVEVLMYAGYPAHRFTIRWPGKEREILFIEKVDTLYRIVHDPTSLINKKMLKSIEFW